MKMYLNFQILRAFGDYSNQHIPTQSIGVCCSHKVVAVGFHTLYYGAERRGMKPSARIKTGNVLAVLLSIARTDHEYDKV